MIDSAGVKLWGREWNKEYVCIIAPKHCRYINPPIHNSNTLTRESTDKSYPRFSLDDGFDPRWSFRLGMGYLRIGSDAQLKLRNIGAFRRERDIVVLKGFDA